MYNQPALRFLVLADFIIDRSLFVLDTPAIMGSRQTAGSVPAPRVEAPSHGSHVTALIAFLAVTGREYHCPHCLLSPFWVLPRSHRKAVSRSVPGRKAWQTEKISDVLLLSSPAHPRAASKAAYAHYNSNGNVFDEWVCSFQSTDPFPKAEKQVKD